MDLSNREAAAHWYRVAADEPDPDLRKQALATHRKYLRMAQREERMRLRLQNPGYGVRSMIGWVVFVALIILATILGLSKVFSVVTVCAVFGLAIGLSLIAAAVTLKVYGHISEDAMLAMIQNGLNRISKSELDKPVIEGTTAAGGGEASRPQRRLPSDAPVVRPSAKNGKD